MDILDTEHLQNIITLKHWFECSPTNYSLTVAIPFHHINTNRM